MTMQKGIVNAVSHGTTSVTVCCSALVPLNLMQSLPFQAQRRRVELDISFTNFPF